MSFLLSQNSAHSPLLVPLKFIIVQTNGVFVVQTVQHGHTNGDDKATKCLLHLHVICEKWM